MAKANKKTIDCWRKHLELWQSSGQSRKEYCRQHGLSPSTMAYWNKKFKEDSPSQPLVKISPLKMAAKESTLELLIGKSARIIIRNEFDPLLLKAVVSALEGEL